MNKLNPKKLLNSKWTALAPLNKEKHFMVIKIMIDEDQVVTECIMQALMSKRDFNVQWRNLKDTNKWQQGWK